MPRFRNVSPYGDLELFGQVREAGKAFDLTAEQAKAIKGQDENFAKVPSRGGRTAAAKSSKKPSPARKPAAAAAETSSSTEGEKA